MIDLEPSKRWKGHGDVFCWVHSPPFFLNPRGVLIHRVRHVETLQRNGIDSHHAIQYLCGGGCCFELGDEDSKFHDDPPTEHLLCDACESKAKRLGEPSADKLAGRHVHRGVLKAHRVCCGGKP